ILACLTVMIIWLGVYPKPFLSTMDASVQKLLGQVNGVVSVQRETMSFNVPTFQRANAPTR
ncbi:MAG: hypothetical protein HY710_07500, partial [Candidatus Latescibacteria bacterium]|nr:hypothetical protein [Candidatus Latescibacterota bacterium]